LPSVGIEGRPRRACATKELPPPPLPPPLGLAIYLLPPSPLLP
jgi:hypothetical protein